MKLRNKMTGEVFDALIRERGGGDTYSIIVCDIKAYNQSKSTLDATRYILDEYDSLDKLNEDWEDYTPPEPLIKDEKIRKAVRSWAEANDITKVWHEGSSVGFCDGAVSIKFHELCWEEITKGEYTIAELCGEEEECES